MIKITFEADNADELFDQITCFVINAVKNGRDGVIEIVPDEAGTPTKEEPKTRKPRTKKPDAPAESTTTNITPLQQSNEEHRKLDEAAPVVNPSASTYVYQDVANAAMDVVKVKGKPVALEVLRKFPHKDGGDKVVNSPQDLSVSDYTKVIEALAAVK